MTMRHPYSFVPFADRLKRETSVGQEIYSALSGTLKCTLRAESPLTIRSYFDQPRDRPYVPASSLRGLTRTMAQMLGAGCARNFAKGDLEKKMGELKPCDSQNACLVCRVFGFAADRADYSWASKVRFYDSDPATIATWEVPPLDTEYGAQWQNHGSRHTRFYFSDYEENRPQKPSGWKVYRHARRVTPAQTESYQAQHCVPQGTEFTFHIDYASLTEEEFSVLHFALTLTHTCAAPHQVTLAHKLGYGKSAGMGSCTIRIDEVIPLALERYFGGQPQAKPQPSCEILHKVIDRPFFQALRDNLAWPAPTDFLLFPPKNWFDDQLGIEDFENDPPERSKKQLSQLSQRPPAPPPPPTPAFPATVHVRLEKAGDGWKGITLDRYGSPPREYTCSLPRVRPPKDGQIREVNVQSVNHADCTFSGKVLEP